MELNKLGIEKVLVVINKELRQGLSVNKTCDKLGVKKSTLRDFMTRNNCNYDRELHQYIMISDDNTCNTTTTLSPIKQDIEPIKEVTIKEPMDGLAPLKSEDDIKNLQWLLNNVQAIQSLLNGSVKTDNTSGNTINLSSTETTTTSLRLNKELYGLIKERSKRDNTPITEILNRALVDYLNNYL